METFFMEKHNAKVGIVPVDLNTGANAGARVSLKDGDRATFLFVMGTSTAAVVNATFNQHDAASSGNSKALSMGNPYYYKAGTDTHFTKVTPAAAESSHDFSTQFVANGGILAVEVCAEDLDVTNNYAWASVSLDDTTAAKLGACIAVVSRVRTMPAYSTDL